MWQILHQKGWTAFRNFVPMGFWQSFRKDLGKSGYTSLVLALVGIAVSVYGLNSSPTNFLRFPIPLWAIIAGLMVLFLGDRILQTTFFKRRQLGSTRIGGYTYKELKSIFSNNTIKNVPEPLRISPDEDSRTYLYVYLIGARYLWDEVSAGIRGEVLQFLMSDFYRVIRTYDLIKVRVEKYEYPDSPQYPSGARGTKTYFQLSDEGKKFLTLLEKEVQLLKEIK